MLDFEVEAKFGLVPKADGPAGAQTNRALYPVIKKRIAFNGGEVDDEDAEWRLEKAIVSVSAAATFVFTDGTNPIGVPVQLAANTPTVIPGPILSGRGKPLSYTTVGAADPRVNALAAEIRHSNSMRSRPIGT